MLLNIVHYTILLVMIIAMFNTSKHWYLSIDIYKLELQQAKSD